MSESGDYYAPNQQVVRGDSSGPADEGDGGSPPNETGVGGPSDDSTPKGDGYDPGEHSVAEVVAYNQDHPDETATILEAERAGRNRSTLITTLEGS